MIRVRPAVESDAPWIRDIIQASYGPNYAYAQFYDVDALRKMILSDRELVLVADDSEAGRPVGTASVILEIGAYTDLVGEFGRLAVHPDWRGRGIGGKLLDERIERVRNRLHIGLMEGRVRHPITQRLARGRHFAAVGYLPSKIVFGPERESMGVFVRHFGDALELRRNNPRVIADVFPVAAAAEDNLAVSLNVIVDDESRPYPLGADFELEVLSTEGYADLLRIERGRVRNREIFGPLRLQYGAFRLEAAHSRYLLAREGRHITGAVGFILDEHDKSARIFELITLRDEVIPFLLEAFVRMAEHELGVCYVDVDVNAHAPRMQRTLLAMGFAPAAYIPAMAFHEVERLDVVKMARLFVPLEESVDLIPPMSELAQVVLRAFTRREVEPRVAEALDRLRLCDGVSPTDRERIAGFFDYRRFEANVAIFKDGDPSQEMFVVLSGSVKILMPGEPVPVGRVASGECLGETALLTGAVHSAAAVTEGPVEVGVIRREDLDGLVRRRPAIGVELYRNLAKGLGEKLRRADRGTRASS